MPTWVDNLYRGLLRFTERALELVFPHAAVMILPEGQHPELRTDNTDKLHYRAIIANMYIRGEGLEIGALNQLLSVPKWARVCYLDRMPLAGLYRHYAEYKDSRFPPVDIIDDGERLAKISDATQDFVIANSILEHFENPLLAVKNMFRVLKTGGILYMAIPDKRYIFDKVRPVTPLRHLLDDYQSETPPREPHYDEWVRFLDPQASEDENRHKKEDLMRNGYSIHYHVWTQTEILEILIGLQRELQLAFQVKMIYSCINEETVVVLQKTAQDQS